ncbi:HDIG domain-containing protein [candidate division KSB1 bacterium]|nr:HDIG domain-containing protein [candidate division KSB1 bacterium]
MMTREQAYQLAKPRFSNKNLFKHVLAVEAVMRGLARHLNEDEEKWALAGLLHDLDYEETQKTPEKHGLITETILKEYDVPPDIVYAIKCHNNLAARKTLMDKALYAADPVTGLIVAATLMHPDKKLKSVDSDFCLRRFKEKSFARGASREQIATCEEMNLSLQAFFDISIAAMQSIDDELGL